MKAVELALHVLNTALSDREQIVVARNGEILTGELYVHYDNLNNVVVIEVKD